MDSGLKRTLEQKVYAGERLTRDDGIALFDADELAWLGRLAHHRRTESFADRATFAADRSIDASEIVYGRAEDPAAHLVDAVLNLREDLRPASLVLSKEDGAPAEALRTFAVARLLLDPAVHLTADYASHGPALVQLLLNYGADDLTGIPAAQTDDQRTDGQRTGSEKTDGQRTDGEKTDGQKTDGEKTGGTPEQRWRNADRRAVELDADQELLELIWDAGLRPVERDASYRVVREHDAPAPLAERRAVPQKVWA
ncbi:aminodeoxyfutalosine synthase [Catenuloplanes nepalensis]|uniref:Aminodeoxyfutalosine synthase n=1 Tax=Catenuloplanes nepalensis TaxID=587533 RepID=A0ABT9N547_9ACTN|nr:aminodeoxyfutalosine synthase [Catenuloplanes nepalensis]